MQQLRNYGDERQTSFCVYCGASPETRDHVPSRILLDEPYPENLPVVPACWSCNNALSKDEEYLACAVESVLTGGVKIDAMQRQKVRECLLRSPDLAARISRMQRIEGSEIILEPEAERVKNVVLKLARGHAAFEINEPQLDDPNDVRILPLQSLNPDERNQFESVDPGNIWPEVGSRAMQRVLYENENNPWIVVQPGRYRYAVLLGNGVLVRIVISEYLVGEVYWD